MIPLVQINAVQVLAIACVGVVIGVWIRRLLPILGRLNIPAAVLGGLVLSLLVFGLRDRVVNFKFDMVLRDVLMLAFFTTIGMGASLTLLKKGGIQVVGFLVLATIGAILQNVVGVGLSSAFGFDPLLGVMTGSVALTGGPGTAAAFGPTFERFGVTGATTIGIAAAMFGISAGGLLGGFISGRIVEKHGLKGGPSANVPVETPEIRGELIRPAIDPEEPLDQSPLFNSVVVVAVSMGLGTLVQMALQSADIQMPGYVGAMFVAAIFRNLDDQFGWFRLNERYVETMGNLALYVFITMAMMDLKLWELAQLALPMVGMLTAQVALVWVMCLAVYRVMGRDYEAAVMAGGFCGFMLGTTANAMAIMGELASKYGAAPRAFIVVPIIGAFLIDFTNSLIVTGALNLLR